MEAEEIASAEGKAMEVSLSCSSRIMVFLSSWESIQLLHSLQGNADASNNELRRLTFTLHHGDCGPSQFSRIISSVYVLVAHGFDSISHCHFLDPF